MGRTTLAPQLGRSDMARLLGDLDIAVDDNRAGFVLDCLSAVRRHLEMDIAYLAELRGEAMVFKAVDAPGLEHVASVGHTHPAKKVYCRHILDGELPRLIADTREEPLAMQMEITRELPVGSHIGIPIERSDGSTYGMFCCLGLEPKNWLNERDLAVAQMFADVTADHVSQVMLKREHRVQTALRLRKTIRGRELTPVFQPVVDLLTGRASGFEALCRFTADRTRPTVTWFDEAHAVGMTVELEVAAIKAALGALEVLPDDVHLAVNASPATIVSGRLVEVLARHPLARLVLEITEHSKIDDYATVTRALDPLRRAGARLAVDDFGAGSAGLQQIVRLGPEIVKLDGSLTSGIERDVAKRALAAAMVYFATETGAAVTAEGVETAADLETLRSLGVHCGQGWHLGYPMALEDAVNLVATSG